MNEQKVVVRQNSVQPRNQQLAYFPLPPICYDCSPCSPSSDCGSDYWRVPFVRIAHCSESLALRQQLAVLKRRHPRKRLHPMDKLFWVLARRFWADWKKSLLVVTPDTGVRWHRAAFRLHCCGTLGRQLPARSARPHHRPERAPPLGLRKETPGARIRSAATSPVICHARLGGLHHR